MKNTKAKSARTAALNDMPAKWGTKQLVDNDKHWKAMKFWHEVNHWSFDQMMEGLDLSSDGEYYANYA